MNPWDIFPPPPVPGTFRSVRAGLIEDPHSQQRYVHPTRVIAMLIEGGMSRLDAYQWAARLVK